MAEEESLPTGIRKGSGPRVLGLLAPLSEKTFLLFWLAQSFGYLGIQVYLVNQSWLVLDISSSLALGTLYTLAAVPRGLLLPVGGILTDMWRPRTILIWSNIAFAAVTALLSALVLTGRVAVWHLVPMALVYGMASALVMPASYAILPELVTSDWLSASNALLQVANQLTAFVGPGLAGALIAFSGIGPTYGMVCVVFLLNALLFVWLKRSLSDGSRQAQERSAQAGMGEALALMKQQRLLIILLGVTVFVNFGIVGPLQIGLPSLARGPLSAGSEGLGLMLSVFGLGSLVGALGAGALGKWQFPAWMPLSAGAALGLVWMVVGRSADLTAAMIALAVAGLCTGLLNVQFVTLVQRLTPQPLLGRMMSFQFTGSMVFQPISYLLTGWTIDLIGPAPIFYAGGLMVLVTSVISLLLA
ncbi:MAG TPA: MFS transporter, partial [Symbiobacteriaceae bacterium]|nr:MFS transporter [Symbiobacteriaceae bacterium]